MQIVHCGLFFYGINSEPNELGCPYYACDNIPKSWNLSAYFTKVFSPRRVHDQKDPGNEVAESQQPSKQHLWTVDNTMFTGE